MCYYRKVHSLQCVCFPEAMTTEYGAAKAAYPKLSRERKPLSFVQKTDMYC